VKHLAVVAAAAAFVAAVPAAAVVTTTVIGTSQIGISTGALPNSNLTATYSAGQVNVLVPRLSLATRQTITRVFIELLIDSTTTGTLTNGTGDQSPRTYRLANSFTGSLVGALPGGSTLNFAPTFQNETNSVVASGGQTVAVNFASGAPQLVASQLITGTNLSLFNANPNLTTPFDEFFRLTFNITGTNVASRPRYPTTGVIPSGNIGQFNRTLQSFVNATVRVHYESREWIPGDPPVPEPATWMMMITGFGLIGAMMRRQRKVDAAA
jgi:hypothetical protein